MFIGSRLMFVIEKGYNVAPWLFSEGIRNRSSKTQPASASVCYESSLEVSTS